MWIKLLETILLIINYLTMGGGGGEEEGDQSIVGITIDNFCLLILRCWFLSVVSILWVKREMWQNLSRWHLFVTKKIGFSCSNDKVGHFYFYYYNVYVWFPMKMQYIGLTRTPHTFYIYISQIKHKTCVLLLLPRNYSEKIICQPLLTREH